MLLKFSNWSSEIQYLTDGVGGCAISMINLLKNITMRKLSSFLDYGNIEMDKVTNMTYVSWFFVFLL